VLSKKKVRKMCKPIKKTILRQLAEEKEKR